MKSFLFIDSLKNDPTSIEETPEGEYVLKHNWDAYWGGAVGGFIDYWLPRKVMFEVRAFGIMKKWITWCHKNDYIDKERFEDYMEYFEIKAPVLRGYRN